MIKDVLVDLPALRRSLLNSDFLDMIPGGFSIATDASCETIIHNPIAAEFLRIEPWGRFSHSASAPPPVKVFRNGMLVTPDMLPMQRAAWYGEDVVGSELEFVWEDGVSRIARWSASPLRDESGAICGCIATMDDITDVVQMARELDRHRSRLEEMVANATAALRAEYEKRLESESQMARLERLNLIGQMAAGIGHEIRNPLTTVRGYLQLLGNRATGDKATYSLMIDELDRANSIITRFLSLAKAPTANPGRLNITEAVRRLEPLLEADALQHDRNLAVIPEQTPDVLVDEKEFTQLVLNLCRNGLEAMGIGGKLVVRTATTGDEAVLTVTDEGHGIPEEHLARLGTPFFTTKETGTGLGLATCYSIAARSNASIEVETGPGGTTFRVRFSKIE